MGKGDDPNLTAAACEGTATMSPLADSEHLPVEERIQLLLDACLARHRSRYGPPIGRGRHRVVFADGDDWVIKVPCTEDGMLDNVREARHDDPGIPLASCELLDDHPDGVPLLRMRRIREVVLPHSQQPEWVGFVDCGQVGYLPDGTLVAFDL